MNPRTLNAQSDSKGFRFSPLKDRSQIRQQKQRRDLFIKTKPILQIPSIVKLSQQATSYASQDPQYAPNHDQAISSLYNTLQSDLQLRDETLDSEAGNSSSTAAVWYMVAGSFALGICAVTVAMMIQKNMNLTWALFKVFRRLMQAHSAKQLVTVLSLYAVFKFLAEPCTKAFRYLLKKNEALEDSIALQLIKMVYFPLEMLLLVTGGCVVFETIVPNILLINKGVFMKFIRSMLSLSFVSTVSFLALQYKHKILHETTWLSSITKQSTEAATQLRTDILDKLFTVATIVGSFTMAMSSIGIQVSSFLTIGGFGSLVIGLAGKEILENMFNGFLIISSDAFKVGEEVGFQKDGRYIEGFTQDIGWYCTTIKSFSREVFTVPNSVFSKTVVLNVSRKNKEFRFYEVLMVKLTDIDKIGAIVSDMRKLVKSDNRILSRLHRRVFMLKVQQEYVEIEISFYLECITRDMFLALRQEFMIDFIGVIHQYGASLAEKKLVIEPSGALSAGYLKGIAESSEEFSNVEETEKTEKTEKTKKAENIESPQADQSMQQQSSSSQVGNPKELVTKEYVKTQGLDKPLSFERLEQPQSTITGQNIDHIKPSLSPHSIINDPREAGDYLKAQLDNSQISGDFFKESTDIHKGPLGDNNFYTSIGQQQLTPKQSTQSQNLDANIKVNEPKQTQMDGINNIVLSQVQQGSDVANQSEHKAKPFDPLESDKRQKRKAKLQKQTIERNEQNNNNNNTGTLKNKSDANVGESSVVDQEPETEFGKHQQSSFTQFSKAIEKVEQKPQETPEIVSMQNEEPKQKVEQNVVKEVIYPEVIDKQPSNSHITTQLLSQPIIEPKTIEVPTIQVNSQSENGKKYEQHTITADFKQVGTNTTESQQPATKVQVEQEQNNNKTNTPKDEVNGNQNEASEGSFDQKFKIYQQNDNPWKAKLEAQQKSLLRTQMQLQELQSRDSIDEVAEETEDNFESVGKEEYIKDIFSQEEVQNSIAHYNLQAPDNEPEEAHLQSQQNRVFAEKWEVKKSAQSPFKNYLKGMSIDYIKSLDQDEDPVTLSDTLSDKYSNQFNSQSDLSEDQKSSNESENGASWLGTSQSKNLGKPFDKLFKKNKEGGEQTGSQQLKDNRKLTTYTLRQVLGLENGSDQYIQAHYGGNSLLEKVKGIDFFKSCKIEF